MRTASSSADGAAIRELLSATGPGPRHYNDVFKLTNYDNLVGEVFGLMVDHRQEFAAQGIREFRVVGKSSAQINQALHI